MGLGWLRLLLSLMVIDAHYGGFRLFIQPKLVSIFGVDRLAFIGEGGVGIAGFFVISGYVIAFVLAHKYDPSSWRGIGLFVLGRALRIYPLYLLVLAIYWAMLAYAGAAPRMESAQLANNVLLLPLGVEALLADHVQLGPRQLTGQLLIGPAWTLCFDLLFYVLAPFLLVWKRPLWIMWGIGLVYLVAFAVTLDPRPPVWFAYLYTSPIVYLFAFTGGALVFHYGERFAGNRLMLGGLFIALFWLTYLPLGFTNAAVNQLLVILVFMGLVALLKDFGKGHQWDRFFGDLTYATYLLHLPLLLLLERFQVAGAPWWGLALTYALACILLFTFEYPLDRWRDTLHRRLSTAAGPPVRAFRLAAGTIVAVLAVAAVISYVRNGLHGGELLVPGSAACPAAWRCVAEPTALQVEPAGEGTMAIDPPVTTAQRVLVDIRNSGAKGSVFAGFEVGGSDGLRVGVQRIGATCELVVHRAGRTEPNPPGWSSDCSSPHRFVLDGSTGDIVVAVDSLWVYPTPQPATNARLTIRADTGSDGSVALTGLFTTSRGSRE